MPSTPGVTPEGPTRSEYLEYLKHMETVRAIERAAYDEFRIVTNTRLKELELNKTDTQTALREIRWLVLGILCANAPGFILFVKGMMVH